MAFNHGINYLGYMGNLELQAQWERTRPKPKPTARQLLDQYAVDGVIPGPLQRLVQRTRPIGLTPAQLQQLRTQPFTRIEYAQGGEAILCRILSLAAETVDVITHSDHQYDKSACYRHVLARDGTWEQNFYGGGAYRYWVPKYCLLRKEVKLRLVCWRWAQLIDDHRKVNLYLRPTTTIRISERYIHEELVPAAVLRNHPFFPNTRYNHLQISFVSVWSGCSDQCEEILGLRSAARRPRAMLPENIVNVEFRFPPRLTPPDAEDVNFSPMCYFSSPKQGGWLSKNIILKVPYSRDLRHASFFQTIRTFEHSLLREGGPYMIYPLRLIISIDAWHENQLNNLPLFVANAIDHFTIDMPGLWKMEKLSIELPADESIQRKMLQAWTRHPIQANTTFLKAKLLYLGNMTTPLWTHFAFLTNTVPHAIEMVTIKPPPTRATYYRQRSAAGGLDEAQWDHTHQSSSFDYSIFAKATWQRDAFGLRIAGPAGVTGDACNDSARLQRVLAARTPRAPAPQQSRFRSFRRAPRVRMPPVLPTKEELAGFVRRYNSFLGERQAWGSLRVVKALHEGRADWRAEERAALGGLVEDEVKAVLRYGPYPALVRYRSW